MADILIRGMEMPKNCSLCKLAQHRMLACSVMCPITGQTVGYYDEGFHQEDHICPLVPLPEGHGRLIDADEFIERVRMDDRTTIIEEMHVAEILSEAPTIVPAEGGNADGD